MEVQNDCCTSGVIATAAATSVLTAALCWLLARSWAGKAFENVKLPHLPVAEEASNGEVKGDAKALMWGKVRRQAVSMAQEDDGGQNFIVPGFMHRSILQFHSLEDALAHVLSTKMATEGAPAARWQQIIARALKDGIADHCEKRTLVECAVIDLQVILERDPACPGPAHALLYFKGFQGLQMHRVSHVLWQQKKRALSGLIQSRMSEVFAMDIHPAARIGVGVMFDHATGVVVGETAVIGDGCTLLHGVTLGGTGKDAGDRHPKVGPHVLIGAGVSILGRCKIGEGAKIGASALVLTDIPPHATAVGCPAKVVGRSKEEDPASKMDLGCQSVIFFKGHSLALCPFRALGGGKDYLGPHEMEQRLKAAGVDIPTPEVHNLFFELDADSDGRVTEKEFEDGFIKFRDVLGRFGHSLATLGCPEVPLPPTAKA